MGSYSVAKVVSVTSTGGFLVAINSCSIASKCMWRCSEVETTQLKPTKAYKALLMFRTSTKPIDCYSCCWQQHMQVGHTVSWLICRLANPWVGNLWVVLLSSHVYSDCWIDDWSYHVCGVWLQRCSGDKSWRNAKCCSNNIMFKYLWSAYIAVSLSVEIEFTLPVFLCTISWRWPSSNYL